MTYNMQKILIGNIMNTLNMYELETYKPSCL